MWQAWCCTWVFRCGILGVAHGCVGVPYWVCRCGLLGVAHGCVGVAYWVLHMGV